MKTLKIQFRKNDLFYTLICRNDKVAMYETRQDEDSVLCHYEVVRICIMPDHTAFGVNFEEAEVLKSNGKFFQDGSGAFIKKDNAMKHFLKLSKSLYRDPKQPSLVDSDLPEKDRSNRYELTGTGMAVLG